MTTPEMLQATFDGVTKGATYALVALGFTLVFGVLRRVDLAYGASTMLGLYGALWLHRHGLSTIGLMGPVALLGTVLSGIYVERLCFAPHRHRPALTSMAASFAIWMQLEECASLMLPRHTYAYPTLWEESVWHVAGIAGQPALWMAMGVSTVSVALLFTLMHRTRFGLAVRALVERPDVARGLGVNEDKVLLRVFVLASLLSGLAGYVLVNIDGQITPMLSMWLTLKGLAAAVLGGLGSLPGALIGGICLGLIENLTHHWWGPEGRDLVVYALMLLGIAFHGRRSLRLNRGDVKGWQGV